jgi:5-formyltetrahydrofolate cyclo-ligase
LMSATDPSLALHPNVIRKAQLREAALQRRDEIPPAERTAAGEAIVARPLPITVRPGTIVSGFMPIRSEINPLPLLRRFAEAGAQLALPTVAGRGKPLIMRAWSFGAPLARGQWGIRQPPSDAPEVFPDILIVPLAAFDRRGYRIGYGAGYYDMTIARLRGMKAVTASGIGYAAQEIAEVPAMLHDERLDLVLTEREAIVCGPA